MKVFKATLWPVNARSRKVSGNKSQDILGNAGAVSLINTRQACVTVGTVNISFLHYNTSMYRYKVKDPPDKALE